MWVSEDELIIWKKCLCRFAICNYSGGICRHRVVNSYHLRYLLLYSMSPDERTTGATTRRWGRGKYIHCVSVSQKMSKLWLAIALTHIHQFLQFLPRDAMQARPMSSCGVCLCVCLSVTFVSSVKTNKHIIKFFSVRYTLFYFFLAKRHSKIQTGTPLTGASNAGGV